MPQAILDAIAALNAAIRFESASWGFLDVGVVQGSEVVGSRRALQELMISHPLDPTCVGVLNDYIVGINALHAKNMALFALVEACGGYGQAAEDYYAIFGA